MDNQEKYWLTTTWFWYWYASAEDWKTKNWPRNRRIKNIEDIIYDPGDILLATIGSANSACPLLASSRKILFIRGVRETTCTGKKVGGKNKWENVIRWLILNPAAPEYIARIEKWRQ